MDIYPQIFNVELCAGTGVLGLGVKTALGDRLRTICYVEREAAAAACLVARMEEAALDRAPIYDDLTGAATDTEFIRYISGFRPLMLTGGFPCQPFSQAGKRAGANDPRHLWPDIARLLETIKPEFAFFENVPGISPTRTIQHRSELLEYFSSMERAAVHAKSAKDRFKIRNHCERLHRRFLRDEQVSISVLHYILCDLERLGYRSAFTIVSAAEVGANHRRERFFILGALEHANGKQRKIWSESEGFERAAAVGESGELLADTNSQRSHVLWEKSDKQQRAIASSGSSTELADSGSARLQERERCEPHEALDGISEYESTPEFCLPLFAPGPDDAETWRQILATEPRLEPWVRRNSDGLAAGLDADRLRLTGNGVVPLAAAYAFIDLAAMLCEQESESLKN